MLVCQCSLEMAIWSRKISWGSSSNDLCWARQTFRCFEHRNTLLFRRFSQPTRRKQNCKPTVSNFVTFFSSITITNFLRMKVKKLYQISLARQKPEPFILRKHFRWCLDGKPHRFLNPSYHKIDSNCHVYFFLSLCFYVERFQRGFFGIPLTRNVVTVSILLILRVILLEINKKLQFTQYTLQKAVYW